MSELIVPTRDRMIALRENRAQFDHLPGPGEHCTIKIVVPGEALRIERGRVMDINRREGLLEVNIPGGTTVLCHISDLVSVG